MTTMIQVLMLFMSIGCFGQMVYQSKIGNQEFQKRMSFYRSKDVESFNVFYNDLFGALEDRNYTQIAALVNYPIRVESKDKYIFLRNRAEFVKRGKLIMNDNFIKSLLCEREKLYCVSKGVQLGQGDLWFNTVNVDGIETWKLITINN
jgi:hypothetical protein